MSPEEAWSQSLRAPVPVRRTSTDLDWSALAERSIVRASVRSVWHCPDCGDTAEWCPKSAISRARKSARAAAARAATGSQA